MSLSQLFEISALKRGPRVLTLLLPLFLLGLSACTSTTPAEPELPEEYLETSEAPAFGIIEEEGQSYQWTDRRYEDPRFAAQLDNSPTKPEEAGIYTDPWVADGKFRQEKVTTGNKSKAVSRKKTKKK